MKTALEFYINKRLIDDIKALQFRVNLLEELYKAQKARDREYFKYRFDSNMAKKSMNEINKLTEKIIQLESELNQ